MRKLHYFGNSARDMDSFLAPDKHVMCRAFTHSARRGFSLVEVVLALGVLSFAMLPMMGLIGSSLQSYRRAINDTVSRQIMTQLAGNAQQARLSNLQAQPSVTSYFDFEGNPVEPNDSLRVYTANVVTQPDTDLLNSTNLYRVQITVTPVQTSDVQRTSLRVCPEN